MRRQLCKNIKTNWTGFIRRRTGYIRRQTGFIRQADEVSPPADEASPPMDEASPNGSYIIFLGRLPYLAYKHC